MSRYRAGIVDLTVLVTVCNFSRNLDMGSRQPWIDSKRTLTACVVAYIRSGGLAGGLRVAVAEVRKGERRRSLRVAVAEVRKGERRRSLLGQVPVPVCSGWPAVGSMRRCHECGQQTYEGQGFCLNDLCPSRWKVTPNRRVCRWCNEPTYAGHKLCLNEFCVRGREYATRRGQEDWWLRMCAQERARRSEAQSNVGTGAQNADKQSDGEAAK